MDQQTPANFPEKASESQRIWDAIAPFWDNHMGEANDFQRYLVNPAVESLLELQPGEDIVAQLRLDTPVSLVRDDRFVARSYSPVRTIGGGKVLNPIPLKHKRFKPDLVEGLKALGDQSPEAIISFHVEASGYHGVSFAHLKIMTNLPDKQLENVLQVLLSQKTLIQVDKENRIYIHRSRFENLENDTRRQLADYHKANPLKPGMPKEELKSKFPPLLTSKLFNLTLNQMIKENKIVQEENIIRLASHSVSLGGKQADVKDKILKNYLNTGLEPPYFKELAKSLDMDAKRAKDDKQLQKYQNQLSKSQQQLEQLETKLAQTT